jgi:hypothetical protein
MTWGSLSILSDLRGMGMIFTGVSYVAILAAALASWVFGAVYYTTLSRPWMAALGTTEEQMKANRAWGPEWVPYVLAFVGHVAVALMFSGMMAHFGKGQINLGNGITSGFFIWLGFVLPPMVINHAFGGNSPRLSLIDGSHWLGALLVQGAVIGLLGAR